MRSQYLVYAALAFGACVERSDVGAFRGSPPVDAGADAGPLGDVEVPPEAIVVKAGDAQLAASGLATCGVDGGGGVVCWGRNDHGELGTGSAEPSASVAPVRVRGMSSGVRAVGGGSSSQCAVREDGAARCWGSMFGELVGVGMERVEFPWPEFISGLSNDVAAIGFGERSGCALTERGKVLCWGFGSAGQLGTGSTSDDYVARQIGGAEPGLVALGVSNGGLFACAVTPLGKVLCWGENADGQLGLAVPRSTLPAEVPSLDARATSGAAGRAHACARLEDRGVACWGSDARGQLGRGSPGAPRGPRRVEGVAATTGLVAGSDHTCALVASGEVICWGSNDFAQVGPKVTLPMRAATPTVPASFGARWVAAGFYHTCAMNAERGVVCLGAASRNGQPHTFRL